MFIIDQMSRELQHIGKEILALVAYLHSQSFE